MNSLTFNKGLEYYVKKPKNIGISFQNIYSMLHDGVNEYINAGTSPDFNFERTNPFSLSTWFKLAAVGDFQYLFEKKRIAPTNRGWALRIQWNNIAHFNLISDASTGNYIEGIGNIVFAQNTWYNVIFTYDGSSNIAGCNLYVNNVQNVITTWANALTGTIVDAAEPLFLGTQKAVSTLLNGNMEESSIWNKVLDPTDRTDIWNDGSPGNLATHSSFISCIFWNRGGDGATWNGTNWSYPDASGHGNTSASVNMEEADRVLDVP